MSSDRELVGTHVPEDQKQRWDEHREDMGFRSRSAWLEAMVEAGLKKFDSGTVDPDETNRELREQRNDLKSKLNAARDEISRLEDELHGGERQTIRDYVEENPGAEYDEIIRHVEETVPSRLVRHLDDLEGDVFRQDDDGGYYLRDEVAGNGGWS